MWQRGLQSIISLPYASRSANTLCVTTPAGDVPSRLREALNHRKMTQRALAEAVSMRETSVSQILSGEQAPKAETIAAICQHLRVHPSWIMLGIEPRYFEDSASNLSPVQPAQALLGVDHWLNEMRDTTPDERAWMRAVPWPTPHLRQPDSVYLMALAAYRQTLSGKGRLPEEPKHP
jgi:transcriptional regulator with XRE-family HTH domain